MDNNNQPLPQSQPEVNQASVGTSNIAQSVNTSPSMPSSSADPGKTLGIIGLVLAFVSSLLGMIISIIALSKSKKAGYKNTPALLGIIVGSVLFLLSAVFLVWFVSHAISTSSACSQYTASKTAYKNCIEQRVVDDAPAASTSGSTLTYTNQNVTFNYPSNWTITPAGSSVTHVDSNGVSASVWQDIRYNSSVFAQYEAYDYGEKDSYTMEAIRGQMQPLAPKYTASVAKGVNATTGSGCADESDDFSFISKPEYIEKDGLAGLTYTFECTGYSGKVKGVYYTTYDQAGNRHTLAGTVRYGDSAKYFGQLEAMVKSFKAV